MTVVTPRLEVWRHLDDIQTWEEKFKSEGIRRILTDHHWRFLAPETLNCPNRGVHRVIGGAGRLLARRLGMERGFGWAPAAETACAHLRREDVDVILASGTPFSAFRVARRLSERLKRPYVLDYRDPWTGNPHNSKLPAYVRRLEGRLLSKASAVTIVSPSWARNLQKSFGLATKLRVISNGYDPGELTGIGAMRFDHFAIVYSGNFYPPKRVITPVMAALRRLKNGSGQSTPPWFFHYFGKQKGHVQAEAEKYGVSDQVIFHGWVPREEALSAIRGADLVVVITTVEASGSDSENGVVTGKIFEPLGLGTPILLIAPPESDAVHIAKISNLACRFSGTDVDGIATFLASSLKFSRSALRDNDSYSWSSLSGEFDVLLRRVALEDRSEQEAMLR